jgi:hypothetical protein
MASSGFFHADGILLHIEQDRFNDGMGFWIVVVIQNRSRRKSPEAEARFEGE